MAKQARKQSKRRVKDIDNDVIQIETARNKVRRNRTTSDEDVRFRHQPFKPKTKNQQIMSQLIEEMTVVVASGPAGTGKSFTAIWKACEMFDDGRVSKIVLTRPAVEADEKLGFLPGEVDEKIAPYFVNYMDTLNRYFGKSHVDNLIRLGKIIAQPLAYIRGLTFDNSFIILDECQNVTVKQMKTFMTRIGRGSKVVVDGDIRQSDLRGENGLQDLLNKFTECPGFGFVNFKKEDVVRSDIVKHILDIYEPE